MQQRNLNNPITITTEIEEAQSGSNLFLHLEINPEQQEEENQTTGNRVSWNTNVIDNENSGQKKSNVCCIFHKKKDHNDKCSCSDSDDDRNDYEK